jgi:hypothetical protein
MEYQQSDHPPLQVCGDGHVPRMYKAVGDCTVAYYVECQLCNVKTARCSTQEHAAHDWALRDVTPIRDTAAAT